MSLEDYIFIYSLTSKVYKTKALKTDLFIYTISTTTYSKYTSKMFYSIIINNRVSIKSIASYN